MSKYHIIYKVLHNKKYIILLSFVFFLFFFISCLSEPENEFLRLKMEETSCTEAWLSIYGQTGHDITLQRDDSMVMEFTLTQSDTTVMDTGLTPSTTYRYQVYAGNEMSDPITATTLDTTSHSFTWQVYEFGGEAGYGSSSFSDVSIINESDIWVTGDISTAEGNFNAVHWDGSKWELKRIYYYGECSAVEYPPLKTVWTFSNESIVISNGGSIGWYNGNIVNLDCQINTLLTGAINKIWGTSRQNLYTIGNVGNIFHYDSQKWTKIESGTTENIQDIWGAENTKTGKNFILSAASQTFRESEDLLLKINKDNFVTNFDWPFEDRKPYSIWFKNERKIYICGDRMVSLTGLNSWKVYDNLSPYFMYKVRGSNLNDVYTVGGYGYTAHFNGKTWYELPEQFYGRYVSVDVKCSIAVAVGYTDRSARVLMLTRNN